MARISIFDRLAEQLYKPTIEPTPEPVGTQGGQGRNILEMAEAGLQQQQEELFAIAEAVVNPPPPPEIDNNLGGDGQGQGGAVVTTKYKIVGNPPNYSVVEGEDGTYSSQAAAQADATRLNNEWLAKNKPGGDEPPAGDGAPQPPSFPSTTVEAGEPVERFNSRTFAEESYPWLRGELLETFLAVYDTNGGDAVEALESLRKTELYKTEFPGIFREDGKTLRFEGAQPELQYVKMKEDFYGQLEQYNLNPEYFKDKITQLFENDVDPDKFGRRLNVAYNTLFPQFDAVKTYYVENYPGVFPTTEDITDEAIFASFIDENVSADIISQRVEISQIGGAFKEQDFAISKEQAQRLLSAGVTGTGAQQLAARAETQLGRLQRISSRFTGREDIFGLSEFIESEVFGEGVSQRLRQRLEAEQATAFTREGGAAVTQAGVTGLVEA